MKISEIFQQDWIVTDLQSRTKDELFRELSEVLAQKVPSFSKESLLSSLWDREKKMTTGIARNIALPHMHLPGLGPTRGLLGISRTGIEYQSLDGEPVFLVFLLAGDQDQPDEHIKVLKSLALLMTNPDFYPSMMRARTPKDVASTVKKFEDLSEFYFS